MTALAAMAISLAACGSSGGKEASPKLRKVKVLLDWTPNTNHSGIYLAKQKGWYTAAGLDVDIIEPGGNSDVLAMVAKGTIDFGISASEQLIPARSKGLPVVSIAAIIQHNTSSLLALKSSGINGLADLQGRTYGAFGGPFEKALIDQLISCGGGDPAGVKFREVGDSDFRQGLTRRVYDFVWVFDAWDTIRLRDLDHLDVTLMPFADHFNCIPDWYTPIMVTNQKHIDSQPELVRAFMDATTRGYQAAMSDPTAAADALLKGAPELDANLVRRSAEYLSTRYAASPERWGAQDPGVWANFVSFLADHGLVERGFPTSAAFTNRFLARNPGVGGD